MALTLGPVIGRIGAPEIRTSTVTAGGMAVTCPAGWGSCHASVTGTYTANNMYADILGTSVGARRGSEIGFSASLTAGQSTTIDAGVTGTLTLIRTT